jgi:alpha-amylase/alpha-mannosidase (GH57 family)
MRSLILHLHLHQPPREDPWLGEVPEDRAQAPDHDATARMERTCYRPLAAARVLDGDGRIARVASTLAWTSLAVAPPLLAWMERHAPETYAAVLAADRASGRRLGGAARGNAIAHPYHHAVLPLLSRRDKLTEVRWGVRDFVRRFGREPVGLWLPETPPTTRRSRCSWRAGCASPSSRPISSRRPTAAPCTSATGARSCGAAPSPSSLPRRALGRRGVRRAAARRARLGAPAGRRRRRDGRR